MKTIDLAFRADCSDTTYHMTWAGMTTFANYWSCGFADGLALN